MGLAQNWAVKSGEKKKKVFLKLVLDDQRKQRKWDGFRICSKGRKNSQNALWYSSHLVTNTIVWHLNSAQHSVSENILGEE